MIEKKEVPQMVFALRLAQKLVQRDQVVHDVCVWLKHVDKFKLGYLTRGEFRAMLRTFGVPEQPGQPFQYDDIFGSHNTTILDYRGFIHLVEVALEQYINPYHTPSAHKGGTLGSTSIRVGAMALHEVRACKAPDTETARAEHILQTMATKLYERRSGSLALTRAFQCVDTDSSGTIDVGEFRACMKLFGFEPREGDVTALFSAFGGGANQQPIPYDTFIHKIEELHGRHPLETATHLTDRKMHTCSVCQHGYACAGPQQRVRLRACVCNINNICPTCILNASQPW